MGDWPKSSLQGGGRAWGICSRARGGESCELPAFLKPCPQPAPLSHVLQADSSLLLERVREDVIHRFSLQHVHKSMPLCHSRGCCALGSRQNAHLHKDGRRASLSLRLMLVARRRMRAAGTPPHLRANQWLAGCSSNLTLLNVCASLTRSAAATTRRRIRRG